MAYSLSHRFKQATKRHDPHRKGWTLHPLPHSALKHLAAEGRSAPDSRSSPATPTWPSWASTCAWARRPPLGSPPSTTLIDAAAEGPYRVKVPQGARVVGRDRKSTRLNSSHVSTS